jgi:hypothetical protein
VPVQLHLAKNALALHLLFQDLESLLDIVVAYENLHSAFLDRAIAVTDAKALGPLAYGCKRLPGPMAARMIRLDIVFPPADGQSRLPFCETKTTP